MTAYREKPVEVEAVQFGYAEYADKEMPFYGDVPEWLLDAFNKGTVTPEFKGEDYWYLRIETLEGPIYAGPNDWIIRGTRGEIYPCKPDVFTDVYEPVTGTTWVHSCGRSVFRSGAAAPFELCTSCGREDGVWSTKLTVGTR